MLCGLAGWGLSIAILLSFQSQMVKAQDIPEDCWEQCFAEKMSDPTFEYRTEYLEFADMIAKARAARVTSGANGTVFLLDTALASDGLTTAGAEATYTYQKQLAQMIALTTPVLTATNPMFVVKYDTTKAWYCFDWQCLGRCDAVAYLDTQMAAPEEESSDPDVIEEACLAASHAFNLDSDNTDADYPCLPNMHDEMAFAFTNSPFDVEGSEIANPCEDADEPSDDTSPINSNGMLDDIINELDGANDVVLSSAGDPPGYCETYFDTRFIVGTNKADEAAMDAWASDSDNSFMVENTASYMEAMDILLPCMTASCCATPGDGVGDGDPDQCIRADPTATDLEAYTP